MSNVSDRKLFKRVAARNKLREIGGIMASSPELMGTVQKFRDGSGPMGVQPGMRFSADLGQSYGPPIRPIASLGAAEVERRKQAELQRRANVAATADPGSLIPNVIDTFDQVPTQELELVASINDASINRQPLQSVLSSEQPVNREETPDQTRFIVDGKEVYLPPGEDVTASEGGYSRTPPPEPRVRRDISGEATTDAAYDPYQQQVSPPNVADLVPYDLNNLDRYGAEELKQAGDNARQELITFLQNPNADPALKQDVILEFAGLKQEDEQLSFEERAKSSAEVFKRLFGRDPEKEQTVDGFNTAMLGFLIAAGDSPNALTNIARGAAQGTKNFMDTARRRQDREDKFKMAGIEKAMRDDESRKKLIMDTRRMLMGYRFQTLNDKIKNLENREALALRFNFETAQIGAKLNTQLEIAKDQNLSADIRAAANREATMLSSLIKSAGVLGVYALGQAGENPTVESFGQAIENVSKNPEDVDKIKKLAEISRIGKSDSKAALTPERQAQTLSTGTNVERFTETAEDQLRAAGLSKPTSTQIQNRTQQLVELASKGTTLTELPPIGTVIEQDGTRQRIVGYGSDARPITEEVVQ